MQLYRNDEDGNLWATEIGSMKEQLNLTEIAKEIQSKGLPEDEIDPEILAHIDSSVIKDEIAVILDLVKKELQELQQRG